MPSAEFEPVIPASERPQTHAPDRPAIGIGGNLHCDCANNKNENKIIIITTIKIHKNRVSAFEPSTADLAGTVVCQTVLGTQLPLYRVFLRRQKQQQGLIPCQKTQTKRLKIHTCALPNGNGAKTDDDNHDDDIMRVEKST